MMKQFSILFLATILFVSSSQNALADRIHDCAKNGDLECVKQEIFKGADINAKDEYGFTALM